MLVLAAISPAVADVIVEGPPGCLREEQLDLEVRQVLGDEVIDRIQLSARLYGTTSWQLSIEVSDAGKLLWERILSVEAADCEFLPALVARSVERGLSSVPGWGIDRPRGEPYRPELGIAATFTLPPMYMRFSLGGAAWLPLSGPVHLEANVEGYGTFHEPVAQGEAQIAGLWAALGPGLEVAAGKDALRASVRGAFGPALVIGREFPTPEGGDNIESVVPHGAVIGDVGFVWRHGLRVGVRAEIALPRIQPRVRDPSSDALLLGDPEPLLRLGLALGYGGRIGSTEGSGRERP